MPHLTGGQAVVAGLRRAGITTLFGIPGVHNGGLYDALLDAPDLRLVVTRHEQGAAFMADGYARASGRTACVVTITGPGVTNASTGLAEAYGESSPVLHIATALGVRSEPAETGELHELRDQSGLLRALVAHHQLVETVADIPHAIQRGLRDMANARPGPVSIEIPLDLLTASGDVALPEPLHAAPSAHPRPRPWTRPRRCWRTPTRLCSTSAAAPWTPAPKSPPSPSGLTPRCSRPKPARAPSPSPIRSRWAARTAATTASMIFCALGTWFWSSAAAWARA